MFDSVSWGELTVVLGLGLFLIGRRDLPRAARVAGTQVGRVVGLLQGARARADRFAAQNELRQLQRELQSGLRQLDLVKAELAVGIGGGGGGIGGGGRGLLPPSPLAPPPAVSPSSSVATNVGATVPAGSVPPLPPSAGPAPAVPLSPVGQSVAAVAEEEWARTGRAFRSRAERGAGLPGYRESAGGGGAHWSSGGADGGAAAAATAGSVRLAHLIQQSLVFDQYDRAVADQDAALRARIAARLQQEPDRRGRAADPAEPTSDGPPRSKEA